jgi:hypothetical protein
VTVVVRHACATPMDAERLRRALTADNPGHVHVEAKGAELVIEVAPGPAASVRATLDDLLACLLAAEKAGADAQGTAHPRP